ncbi:SH3 domain-containing protein [Luteococcus sp. Sow4_B9]|uniref:SH3 domain-containing protein n=1 Tax=Luteococcus sp. Sow4_B9 TaxID=3438792 RepID=UPI003F98CC48
MSALRCARALTASAVSAALLVGGTQLVLGELAQARDVTMSATVGLNVRSGPSTSTQILGVLQQGEDITMTGPSSGGWAPVTYRGKKAFVAAQYLTSAGATTPVAAARTGQGRANTLEALNVRSGPSIDSAVITTLGKGASVTLTGRVQGDWSQITLNGRQPWVNNAWLAGPGSTPATPTTVKATSRARATTALMMRTTSDSSFRNLGDVPTGTILDLTGKRENGVAQVIWQGSLRWVNANFLTPVGSTPTLASPKSPGTIGTRWTTTTLSIRPASTGLRYLYDVPPGTALKVTGTVENGRAQVVVNGAVRWVTARYLTSSQGSPARTLTGTPGGSLNTGGSRGLDSLVPAAKGIVWHIRATQPQISTLYGVRQDPLPDHPSGHAVDVMIPSYRSNQTLGWQIARDLQSRAGELGIKYIIWDQKIWSVARSSEGWRPMANRGGDTANHKDHVHVTVN